MINVMPGLGVAIKIVSRPNIVLDSGGKPVGVTTYGRHAIEERVPIATVRGLDDLVFDLEPM